MAFSAFAVAAPGLEILAARELSVLGVSTSKPETGGVAFEATEHSLASALIGVRTITRILLRVAEFRTTTFAHLEKKSNGVPWPSWVSEGTRVRFRATCRKSRLYHSDAVIERIAGALSSSVRNVNVEEGGDDDGEENDSQLFVVRMSHDVCTISIDAAGSPLYKRGYRLAVAKAPIRETLAAAMLRGANWNGASAIHDPFCGSGTLAIEAALIARNISPGLNRNFAAERWPLAKERTWLAARTKAREAVIPRASVPITGGDRDGGAIEAAQANAQRAGVEEDVAFEVTPVSASQRTAETGLLITNPPYGLRVGDRDMRNLYARFGQVARVEFAGWNCAVLFGDNALGREMESQFGLPMRPAWRSMNGGIPIRLLTGEIPSSP